MSSKGKIALIYSSKDDEPLGGGVKGWVTNFNKFLSTLLYQITRENPELVLMTEKNFESSKLSEFAVLLCVMSEHLEKEKPIVQVINQYGKVLKKSDRMNADGVARFLKFLKDPLIQMTPFLNWKTSSLMIFTLSIH